MRKRCQIFFELIFDAPDDGLLGRGPHKAHEVIVAAVFGNEPDILFRRFGPCFGHVADQGAEDLALPEPFANVADVEQQLHRESVIFKIGQVEKNGQVSRRPAAHAAGDGEKVEAGAAAGAVCLGTVQCFDIAGFCF